MTLVVSAFKHADYGDPKQDFGPGAYRADREQLNIVGNDQISLFIVPLGLGLDAHEHEGDGNGAGKHKYFGPGNHRYVGDDLNDEISLLIVRDHSSFYFSSGELPSVFPTPGSTGERYYRYYTNPIPAGHRVEVWEATKNGSAGWHQSIQDGHLTITLWVHRHAFTTARNWVGVNVRAVPI